MTAWHDKKPAWILAKWNDIRRAKHHIWQSGVCIRQVPNGLWIYELRGWQRVKKKAFQSLTVTGSLKLKICFHNDKSHFNISGDKSPDLSFKNVIFNCHAFNQSEATGFLNGRPKSLKASSGNVSLMQWRSSYGLLMLENVDLWL